MSPSSCYENLGCYCSCLGCLSIAPFLPREICSQSYCILVSRQYYSSINISKGGPGGTYTWTERCPEHFCTTGFSIKVALTFPLFKLQVNTRRQMLPFCFSALVMTPHLAGQTPNYVQYRLHQLGLGLKGS